LYSHTLVGAVYSRYTADSSISSLHFGCAAENAKACRGISRALLIIHSFLTITNTIQSNLKTWHCPFIQSTIQMVHCDGSYLSPAISKCKELSHLQTPQLKSI